MPAKKSMQHQASMSDGGGWQRVVHSRRDLRQLNLPRSGRSEKPKQPGTGALGRYPTMSSGSAVVDFTRSMLKRELTFLTGTAAIKRL